MLTDEMIDQALRRVFDFFGIPMNPKDHASYEKYANLVRSIYSDWNKS